MKHRYRSNQQLTARRIRRYDEYMRREVLDPAGHFVCASARECLDSARVANPGCSYYEGQLGYIGSHYDLSVDGTPWRMLFVGMELGGTIAPYSRIDRVTRSADHTRAYVPANRNPHMNGVVLGIRYALGLGAYGDAEWVEFDGTGERAHVLDCYALMNARLCSATEKPYSNASAGTDEMTRRCFRHLQAVMEILEPTLVVIQGKGLWRELGPLLPGEDIGDGRVALRRVASPVSTLVAALSHPRSEQYRWQASDDFYFQGVVAPAICAAVQIARSDR